MYYFVFVCAHIKTIVIFVKNLTMSSISKSFGTRVPLEVYLRLVEVASKNKVAVNDVMLYALNKINIFDNDFSFHETNEEIIENRNELQRLKLENDRLEKQCLSNGKFFAKLSALDGFMEIVKLHQEDGHYISMSKEELYQMLKGQQMKGNK